uniref:Transmembrane protein 97 n=1 Tax=Paramormyrops kingsleyae TaxID=1676925 RepID=A0A3B3SLD3_9TELE
MLTDLLKWYAAEFKDPMMLDPPIWFKSFVFSFKVHNLVTARNPNNSYCRWIRTPAIIYSTHVATTLIPILAYILFNQFPNSPHPGPKTSRERLTLMAIYSPYLIIPLMLLLTMLYHPLGNKKK